MEELINKLKEKFEEINSKKFINNLFIFLIILIIFLIGMNTLFGNKDKDLVNMAYSLFIDMVIVFFGDVITPSPKSNVWYDESVLRYRNNVNYSAILHVILESKSQLGRSVNLALAVDQMFYNLKEVM